jgi:transcriptional regulator with XRE-family HTH domain
VAAKAKTSKKNDTCVREMARKIGRSASYTSRVLGKKRIPSVETIIKMAAAQGVTVDEVIKDLEIEKRLRPIKGGTA